VVMRPDPPCLGDPIVVAVAVRINFMIDPLESMFGLFCKATDNNVVCPFGVDRASWRSKHSSSAGDAAFGIGRIPADRVVLLSSPDTGRRPGLRSQISRSRGLRFAPPRATLYA